MDQYPCPPNAIPMASTTPAQSTRLADFETRTVAAPGWVEDFVIKYEQPLYTEIHIALPRLPAPKSPRNSESAFSSTSLSPSAKSRGRARSLSSFSPFRRRSSTPSSSRDAEEWPRIRKEIVKSREVHAMMDLRQQHRRNRSGTIDALAVVPAVLVLSAELFTPGTGKMKGEGGRKDSGMGRWEDGIR